MKMSKIRDQLIAVGKGHRASVTIYDEEDGVKAIFFIKDNKVKKKYKSIEMDIDLGGKKHTNQYKHYECLVLEKTKGIYGTIKYINYYDRRTK